MMTLTERVNELKKVFFMETKLKMTANDKKHAFDLDYEFSEKYSKKLDELLDYDEDWYHEYLKWLKSEILE